MSNKQYNLTPFQNIPTQAVSGNITSAITDIRTKDIIGIELAWTGTVNGTFDVQVSASYNPITGTGTWTSLSFSTAPVASGAPGSLYLDLYGISPAYIKVVFTYVGGSGNLTGTITGKAI